MLFVILVIFAINLLLVGWVRTFFTRHSWEGVDMFVCLLAAVLMTVFELYLVRLTS